MSCKQLLLAICLCITGGLSSLWGQSQYVPLNTSTYDVINRLDIKYGRMIDQFHTSQKPYTRRSIATLSAELEKQNLRNRDLRLDFDLDYLIKDNPDWQDSLRITHGPLAKIFYTYENAMMSAEGDDFYIQANPVLDFRLGYEGGSDQKIKLVNTRGASLRFDIKKRLGAYVYIGENQQLMFDYINRFRDQGQRDFMVGEGYYKEYRTTGTDYFTPRGYITANALDHIDFQFGYDKHFWGNGIRSLFLSDQSNAYLFFKMQTRFWKVSYTNLFTEFIHQYNRGADRLLDKKYGAFHHLNIHATNWLDIGLFEGIVMTRSNQFELHYLTPIIFYRAVEQDLGSPDNAFIGIDYKVNFFETAQVYGQFLLDEFNFAEIRARNGWWANKFAIQTGVKYVDAFGVPFLDLQVEHNLARPYVYTHSTPGQTAIANYTHYNQSIAHPLGANFNELLGIGRYRLTPQIGFELHYMWAKQGLDTANSHWGSSLFPETNANTVEQVYQNSTGQGDQNTIHHARSVIRYNPWHNLYIEVDLGWRRQVSALTNQDFNDFYLMGGLRWNVGRRNYIF